MVHHVRDALDDEGRLLQIPFDHPIYHSYYDLPGGFPGERRGRVDLSTLTDDPWFYPDLATRHRSPYLGLWGAEWQGELVAVFSPQQVLGLGRPETTKTPWLRAATNVVVYALTREGSVAERRPPGFWAYSSSR
jgi:hypothetical protein